VEGVVCLPLPCRPTCFLVFTGCNNVSIVYCTAQKHLAEEGVRGVRVACQQRRWQVEDVDGLACPFCFARAFCSRATRLHILLPDRPTAAGTAPVASLRTSLVAQFWWRRGVQAVAVRAHLGELAVHNSSWRFELTNHGWAVVQGVCDPRGRADRATAARAPATTELRHAVLAVLQMWAICGYVARWGSGWYAVGFSPFLRLFLFGFSLPCCQSRERAAIAPAPFFFLGSSCSIRSQSTHSGTGLGRDQGL
jgi:hypothetical protein